MKKTNLKLVLPCLAVLPLALFAFKSSDVAASNAAFQNVGVVETTSPLTFGEGSAVAERNVRISTDFSTGVSDVRETQERVAVGLINTLSLGELDNMNAIVDAHN